MPVPALRSDRKVVSLTLRTKSVNGAIPRRDGLKGLVCWLYRHLAGSVLRARAGSSNCFTVLRMTSSEKAAANIVKGLTIDEVLWIN